MTFCHLRTAIACAPHAEKVEEAMDHGSPRTGYMNWEVYVELWHAALVMGMCDALEPACFVAAVMQTPYRWLASESGKILT